MSLKKIESQVYLTAFNNAHLSESFIHLLAAKEPVKDVDFLLTHHWFQTSDKYDANTPGKGEHLYRGQSNAEWQICPSVFRNPLCLDTYTPQGPGKYDQEITDIKHWLGMHLHAELRSIAIFLDSADKQGIETPIDFALLTKHRKIIRRSFDNIARTYEYVSKIYPEE